MSCLGVLEHEFPDRCDRVKPIAVRAIAEAEKAIATVSGMSCAIDHDVVLKRMYDERCTAHATSLEERLETLRRSFSPPTWWRNRKAGGGWSDAGRLG